MKKNTIVFLMLGFTLASFVGYMVVTSKRTIEPHLSERAKEYLEDQKENHDETWRGIDLDATGTPSQSQIEAKPCFSITVPFEVSLATEEKVCMYRITTRQPLGKIVVYQAAFTLGQLEDDAGVRLRSTDIKVYAKESIEINGRNFLIFTKKEGAETTAFSLKNNELFVLTMLDISGEQADKDFIKMLDSVVFYNEK